MPADVLLVSLGSTAGLRAADAELAGALRRAGRDAWPSPRPRRQRDVRTLALTDLALGARRAARPRGAGSPSTTRARSSTRRRRRRCCGRGPGAIRYDAPAAANRPGRHGVWQRPLERRRLRAARRCSCPQARGARRAPAAARARGRRADPGRAVGPRAGATRDIAAITYAANPHKKGLDRVLAAWAAARRDGEELVVAGRRRARGRAAACAAPGVLPPERVPRAAAPRARLRHRAAPRGLRHRPARGAGRRLRARDDAARPGRTPRCRSPARSTRGSSATTSPPALRAALDDAGAGLRGARAARRSRRTAAPRVDRVVAERAAAAPAGPLGRRARACAARANSSHGRVLATCSAAEPRAPRGRDAPAGDAQRVDAVRVGVDEDPHARPRRRRARGRR